jgi:hypothetical protein
MVNRAAGCGRNQFDLDFNPIPAINIFRTCNAERVTGETVGTPADNTSYGHNLELVWLLDNAAVTLGSGRGFYRGTMRMLVGLLYAYRTFGDERYLDAFARTWEFDKKYFISNDVGEWRQLLTREGKVIIGSIGNPRKAIYHTGRAVNESIKCIEDILRVRPEPGS